MSTIPEIPAYQADLESDHELIEKLYTIAKADEKRKQVVVKTYVVHNKPLSPLTSWNMRESVYKKKNPEFPTKARGLFTVRDKNKYKVVVRGYDKFFNVGETSETEWPSLEKETEGPFEVTVKENGCIIFIAAISESEIVVTSKHSIPDPQDDPAAHAGVGYNWLLKHLSTAGRTLDELTKWLHAKSITLVAELCDDAFEEHVLAYEPKESGLYLHGINYNTGTLHTLPIETVRGVARYFGFHSIDYVKLDTLQQVRKLAEETKENGEFQGRLIEGIVVRCKRQNMDFFFKIKNDKYLLYREWREATKALIDVKDGAVKLKHGVQPRCQYEKTKYYVLWLRERLQDHPEWFKDYKHNKGIINVRRRFEEFYENGDLSSLKGDPDAAVKFTQKKF